MLTKSAHFSPMVLKGVKANPNDPLQFSFMVDTGDQFHKDADQELIKNQSQRLIKYFLASLAIPEEDQWVNLSPYEEDHIIPEAFGKTEMGRDLLAQDYLLKQLSASLIYPEDDLGKQFWKQIYDQAYSEYGTTYVPMDTFHKIWIIPKRAHVFERGGAAYVVDAELDVMLAADYENQQYQKQDVSSQKDMLSTNIFRTIILPLIRNQVNQGKYFANLRQIYHSMVLAAWFKRRLKQSFMGQVYADRNKTGFIQPDPQTENIEHIYEQYVQAYQQGVFNYIKEEFDQTTQEHIPRKYFSGGYMGRMMNQALYISPDLALIATTGVNLDDDSTTLQIDASMQLEREDSAQITTPEVVRTVDGQSLTDVLGDDGLDGLDAENNPFVYRMSDEEKRHVRRFYTMSPEEFGAAGRDRFVTVDPGEDNKNVASIFVSQVRENVPTQMRIIANSSGDEKRAWYKVALLKWEREEYVTTFPEGDILDDIDDGQGHDARSWVPVSTGESIHFERMNTLTLNQLGEVIYELLTHDVRRPTMAEAPVQPTLIGFDPVQQGQGSATLATFVRGWRRSVELRSIVSSSSTVLQMVSDARTESRGQLQESDLNDWRDLLRLTFQRRAAVRQVALRLGRSQGIESTMSLGEVLRRCREYRQMSLEQVADAIGVGLGDIFSWERQTGQNIPIPSLYHLNKLSAFYGIELYQFLPNTDDLIITESLRPVGVPLEPVEYSIDFPYWVERNDLQESLRAIRGSLPYEQNVWIDQQLDSHHNTEEAWPRDRLQEQWEQRLANVPGNSDLNNISDLLMYLSLGEENGDSLQEHWNRIMQLVNANEFLQIPFRLILQRWDHPGEVLVPSSEPPWLDLWLKEINVRLASRDGQTRLYREMDILASRFLGGQENSIDRSRRWFVVDEEQQAVKVIYFSDEFGWHQLDFKRVENHLELDQNVRPWTASERGALERILVAWGGVAHATEAIPARTDNINNILRLNRPINNEELRDIIQSYQDLNQQYPKAKEVFQSAIGTKRLISQQQLQQWQGYFAKVVQLMRRFIQAMDNADLEQEDEQVRDRLGRLRFFIEDGAFHYHQSCANLITQAEQDTVALRSDQQKYLVTDALDVLQNNGTTQVFVNTWTTDLQNHNASLNGSVGSLGILVENLINNARGDRKDTEVNVHFHQESSQFVATVTDNNPHYVPTDLFEIRRLGLTGRKGGTGIGLTHIFYLAQNLGATLEIENTATGTNYIVRMDIDNSNPGQSYEERFNVNDETTALLEKAVSLGGGLTKTETEYQWEDRVVSTIDPKGRTVDTQVRRFIRGEGFRFIVRGVLNQKIIGMDGILRDAAMSSQPASDPPINLPTEMTVQDNNGVQRQVQFVPMTPDLIIEHQDEFFALQERVAANYIWTKKRDLLGLIGHEGGEEGSILDYDEQVSFAVMDTELGIPIAVAMSSIPTGRAGHTYLEIFAVSEEFEGTVVSSWLLYCSFFEAQRQGYEYSAWRTTATEGSLRAVDFYIKIGAELDPEYPDQRYPNTPMPPDDPAKTTPPPEVSGISHWALRINLQGLERLEQRYQAKLIQNKVRALLEARKLTDALAAVDRKEVEKELIRIGVDCQKALDWEVTPGWGDADDFFNSFFNELVYFTKADIDLIRRFQEIIQPYLQHKLNPGALIGAVHLAILKKVNNDGEYLAQWAGVINEFLDEGKLHAEEVLRGAVIAADSATDLRSRINLLPSWTNVSRQPSFESDWDGWIDHRNSSKSAEVEQFVVRTGKVKKDLRERLLQIGVSIESRSTLMGSRENIERLLWFLRRRVHQLRELISRNNVQDKIERIRVAQSNLIGQIRVLQEEVRLTISFFEESQGMWSVLDNYVFNLNEALSDANMDALAEEDRAMEAFVKGGVDLNAQNIDWKIAEEPQESFFNFDDPVMIAEERRTATGARAMITGASSISLRSFLGLSL